MDSRQVLQFTGIKNRANTFSFPLINSANRPAYFTGSEPSFVVNAYSWRKGQTPASHTIATGTIGQLGSTGLWEINLTTTESNPNSGNDDFIIIKISGSLIDEQTLEIALQDEHRIMYVDDAGDNTYGDGSLERPLLTITQAVTYGAKEIVIIDELTLPNSTTNATQKIIRGMSKDRQAKLGFAGANSILRCDSLFDLHIWNDNNYSLSSPFEIEYGLKNLNIEVGGTVTGDLFDINNRICFAKDIQIFNCGNFDNLINFNDAFSAVAENISSFHNSPTSIIRINRASGEPMLTMRNCSFGDNPANIIDNADTEARIICENVFTDGSETNFNKNTPTAGGYVKRFRVWEKDNINVALNSLITIDTNVDTSLAALTTIDNNIDTLITSVTTSAFTQSALAAITTIDTVVDAIKVKTDTIPAVLTRTQYVDFMNREVTDRNGAEPTEVKIGTGGNQKTVDVTYETIGSVSKVKQEVAS